MSNRDTQEPSESETQGLVPNLPEDSDGETINIAGTEITEDASPQPAQDKYKGFPQVAIPYSERKHRTRSATQSLPPSSSNAAVAARINKKQSKPETSNPRLSFGNLDHRKIAAVCNTESAEIVKSVGKLENRLDTEVSSKAELTALKAQVQEILNAQRVIQEEEDTAKSVQEKDSLAEAIRVMRSDLNRLLEEKSIGHKPEEEFECIEAPCEEPDRQEHEQEPYPHYSELPSVRAQQAQAQESQRATQVKKEPAYPKRQYYQERQAQLSYQKRREYTGSHGRQHYPESS